MEIHDMEAAIKDAADSIRKTPVVRKCKNANYAIVVKVGFEEIQKLRDEGYSNEVICKTLTENGVLNAGSSPKSFCSVFLRETKRRFARTQGKALDANKTPVSKTEFALAKPGAKKPETPPAAAITESEEAMHERIKRMTSREINTGTGKIIKHYDGTFDYE